MSEGTAVQGARDIDSAGAAWPRTGGHLALDAGRVAVTRLRILWGLVRRRVAAFAGVLEVAGAGNSQERREAAGRILSLFARAGRVDRRRHAVRWPSCDEAAESGLSGA
jgi:hypothetical protein